jgi:hypothetical protein
MDISLKKVEHFFSNDKNLLSINENGMKIIINAMFADESFKQEFFTREFAAQTIDIFLNNPICRKMIFEAIKGNFEYKQQLKKYYPKIK